MMKNIAVWCQGSIEGIVALCDWHVQRPSDGGVLAFKSRPGAKILAVAHLDYHCSGKVHEVTAEKIVSSALDDRLGACLAYNLQTYAGVTADVVFCDKEETGNSTLPLLGTKMLDKYNWIVEFDRRLEGAVCYQYHVMEKYIRKHFEFHHGTFSDICTICHTSPIGAFNVAVGYNQEHSETCYATADMIRAQMARFAAFYTEFGDTKILHTPPAKTAWQYRQSPVIGGYHTGWNDDDDDAIPSGSWYKDKVWDQKERKWVADKKGNVIKLPEKTASATKDDNGDAIDDASFVLSWKDLSAEERDLVKKAGWFYVPLHDCFTRVGNVNVVGVTPPADALTLETFFKLDDDANEQDYLGMLADMARAGELTPEDLAEYEQLGYRQDPDTGEFYAVKKEG